MTFYPTHLHGVTSVRHVAAVAATRPPAAVHGAAPKRAGVILRLGGRDGGLAAKKVLLGRAGTRRLGGGQSRRSAFQVSAHLEEGWQDGGKALLRSFDSLWVHRTHITCISNHICPLKWIGIPLIRFRLLKIKS